MIQHCYRPIPFASVSAICGYDCRPTQSLVMKTYLKPLQDVEKCEPIRCQVPRRLVKRRKDTSLWPVLRLLRILRHVTDVGSSPKAHSGPRDLILDLHGIKAKRHQQKKTIYCTVAHKKEYSGKCVAMVL